MGKSVLRRISERVKLRSRTELNLGKDMFALSHRMNIRHQAWLLSASFGYIRHKALTALRCVVFFLKYHESR
jgi:hypothetical protein